MSNKKTQEIVSLDDIDQDVIMAKAIDTYWRECKREGFVFCHPSSSGSYIDEIDGKLFVRLKNVNGLLASYRILPNYRLRKAL
jgi:hypothetical protein